MNLGSAKCLLVAGLFLIGCGSSSQDGNESSNSTPGAAGHESNAVDVPFQHPDVPIDYVPQPGNCGFDAPAFCDDFENGPAPRSRSGELTAANWSVARGMPQNAYTPDDVM